MADNFGLKIGVEGEEVQKHMTDDAVEILAFPAELSEYRIEKQDC